MDYGDSESPNPALQPVPTSNTMVADLRHATSSTTDAKLTSGVGIFHGSEPPQEVTNIPSSKITSADSTTMRKRTRRTSAVDAGDAYGPTKRSEQMARA